MRRFAVMLLTLTVLLAALFFLSHRATVEASEQVLTLTQSEQSQARSLALSPTRLLVEGVPTYFSDDFEGYGLGSLPAPWVQSGASWQVLADSLDADNQVASTSGAADGHYVTLRRGEFTWGDQALAMRFRWNGAITYYWGVMGVRLDQNNGGYYVSLRGQNTNHLYLYLVRSSGSCVGGYGSQNLCGLDLGQIEPNRWYTLMLRAKGNKLQLFVDGYQVGGTITDQQNLAPTGRMGLGAAHSPIIVLDDVQHYDWTGVPAILDFSTNPPATRGKIHLMPNQAITFNWTVTDTQAVTLTANGITLATGNTGTFTHSPTEDTLYTLSALGVTANISQSITALFPPRAEVLDFSSSSAALVSGEALTLTWTVTNATSIEIEGLGTFNTAIPTGTVTLFPTQTTNYVLNAIGVGNTDTAQSFVFVHDGTVEPRTLFYDDFDSYALGVLPAPWEVASGGWQVFADTLEPGNQAMSTSSSTEGHYVSVRTGDFGWGDQAVSMRFRWNGETSLYYWGSMGVRLNEDNSGYYLSLRGQYTNHLYLYLTRQGHSGSDWFSNCLGDFPGDDVICGLDVGEIEPSRWYTIMLRAKGNRLQLFLDGQPIGPIVTDNQNVAPTGRIGFAASHSPTILLDDIQVEDLTGIPAIFDFGSTPAATNNHVALVQGESINLTWNVSLAQISLTANGVTIADGLTGTLSHTPSEDTEYRLTAVGTAGTVSETINAHLYPPAEITSFSASAEAIIAASPVTLTWATTNATTTTLNGVLVSDNGQLTTVLTQTKSYTLTAIGPANSESSVLTVYAGNITGIEITPHFLPDLEEITETLQLGAEYETDIGLRVPVTEPITWTWAPPEVLTIDADGTLTPVANSSYTGSVQLTATIAAPHQASRFIYRGLPLLSENADFEQSDWWSSWLWEGTCQKGYVSDQARNGTQSFRLNCANNGRVGLYHPALTLPSGTYRLRGYLRGLNIKESGLWGNYTDVLHHKSGTDEFESRDLLYGSFGWTPFEATYRLTESTTSTFYLRLFAPGTLWIDDLSISRVDNNEAVTLRFGEPETATPSPCENEQPVCTSAPSPELAISDFANDTLSPFVPTGGLTTAYTDTAEGSQLDISGSGYLDAWYYSALPTDWEGYDYLIFDVYNKGDEIVDFYVEIRDHLTTGYWSRVNWYDKLAPGMNHFRIPLQIFVGERITILEQRRLDLSDVRRLVLSFPTNGAYRLSQIHLEEEPFKCSRPDWLHAFDFGPTLSPIMPSFHPIMGDTTYAACRGYGLSNEANISRIEDRRHPDPLYRDWISFHGSGEDFLLDLPNGDYEVLVAWKDAGYWEYFQNYTDRRVYAEGVLGCQEGQSFSDFLDNYYQFESHEGLPGQDNWEIYISPHYQPSCTFSTTVSDGQLNLDFVGWHAYAATINALFVYPITRTVEAQTWLAQVEEERRITYNYDYRRLDLAGQQPEPAALPGADDWIVFQRDISEEIFANTIPAASEVITQITAIVAPNERTPATFALYPRIDLGEVVSLTLSGAPTGLTITPYAVTYLDRRVTADGTVYASRPHLLQPVPGIPLPAHQSRRFWLGITADDSPELAGSYELQLNLQTTNGQNITLPLLIEVLPFTLPEQPIRHSVLGSMSLYPYDSWGQMTNKMWQELPDMLQLLHQYGMNALTGPYLASWNGSSCDTTHAQAYIAALSLYDFDPLINTYAGKALPNLSGYYGALDTANATAALNCSIDVYAAAGYTLTWSLYDEPGTVIALQNTLDLVSWIDSLPDVNAPGFLSSGYHSVHSNDTAIHDLQSQLFRDADMPYVTLFDQTAASSRHGRPWGLYNHLTRFGYGYYAWMLHKKYGLTDVTAFALQSVNVDPYYTLDGREQDYAFIFTTKSGQLRPTIDLEELALGINDFRYLTALENAIAAANPTHPATIAATQFLSDTLNSITVESRTPSFSLSDTRQLIAQHIIALQPPLAVQLATFTATQQGQQVLINWQTTSELNNLGFNLYRSTTPSQDALIQLNSSLIPSQAPSSAQGSDYQWRDNTLQPGITYHYWLEDININGSKSLHSPITLTVNLPSSVTITSLSSPNSSQLWAWVDWWISRLVDW